MHSQRIALRALEIDDYKKIVTWRMNGNYLDGTAPVNHFASLDTEKKWVENAINKSESMTYLYLAIVDKQSLNMIGLIYLIQINLINKSAVLGSLIGKSEYRVKGYLSEARNLILNYAFDHLGLERLSTSIIETNTASIKSVEKFGFTKEGVLRDSIYKRGKFINLIAYSILKTEFKSIHE